MIFHQVSGSSLAKMAAGGADILTEEQEVEALAGETRNWTLEEVKMVVDLGWAWWATRGGGRRRRRRSGCRQREPPSLSPVSGRQPRNAKQIRCDRRMQLNLQATSPSAYISSRETRGKPGGSRLGAGLRGAYSSLGKACSGGRWGRLLEEREKDSG